MKHAKDIHKPKKNGVCIYYEEIDGLVKDKKVGKCLEKECIGVINEKHK